MRKRKEQRRRQATARLEEFAGRLAGEEEVFPPVLQKDLRENGFAGSPEEKHWSVTYVVPGVFVPPHPSFSQKMVWNAVVETEQSVWIAPAFGLMVGMQALGLGKRRTRVRFPGPHPSAENSMLPAYPASPSPSTSMVTLVQNTLDDDVVPDVHGAAADDVGSFAWHACGNSTTWVGPRGEEQSLPPHTSLCTNVVVSPSVPPSVVIITISASSMSIRILCLPLQPTQDTRKIHKRQVVCVSHSQCVYSDSTLHTPSQLPTV